MIRNSESVRGSDLELPLTRHHLGIDTAQEDTGVETRGHVFLNELTTEDLVTSNTAIEWSLLGWVAACGPTKRSTVLEHCVLLLNAEQGLML